MKVQKGSVVRAKAGRDKDNYFVITDFEEKYCLIADGKSRKLSSPKKKNIRHLCFTNSVIELNDVTDKKLRRMMKEFMERTE